MNTRPTQITLSSISKLRERWRRAYAAQRSLVDEGITQSLWKAPGL